MTRADLAAKLAYRMKISKKEADSYLLSFLDAIMSNLEKEGRIVVQGFGAFHLRTYPERIGKKPITSEPIPIPKRNKPFFIPSKELKEIINNGSPKKAPEKNNIIEVEYTYTNPMSHPI